MRVLGRLGTPWRVAAMAAGLGLLFVAGASAAERPNVVYILADDLGWKDVGFHEGSVRTPQLDRLAASGAVLNAFYVQPFSTQTRAALMTGRYPMRYGLQTGSILPASRYGLPEQERTLGQALKDAGYATAFLGKWQLGHARAEFWPTRRGFEYFYGTLSGDVGFALKKTAKADWRRNEQAVREDGYVTALLARDAVKFIDRQNASQPFLLVLSFAAPAAPYGAPKQFVDLYGDLPDSAQRDYSAAVTALDQAVGEVLSALERRKLLDNTLIVFHSDNGGALPTKYPTGDADVEDFAADNGIFREGKGSLYEGGVRVVALASWPGRIPPKSTVVDMVHVADMYATILKLAGATLEQEKKLDGVDVWPALAGTQRSPRKEVLINVEDFSGAIRVGEWKLVVYAALPSRMELFNIANDPEEAANLAGTYPERVKELMGKLTDYAYDMAQSKYLEELATAEAGRMPLLWRHNPVRR
ncbi:MAG TPA: arylsulfatase [Burkholderiales bacterium]|nr:arylsulfatase [Burkholderiales bacterium]